MLVQISSGQGPAECELAVGLLFASLQAEFPEIEKIDEYPAKEKGCYKSILFSIQQDLPFPDGSILWIAQSPFRPHHKRKNWFVDVSVIPEKAEIIGTTELKEKDLRLERFHCGGKGGQNVNKVETGVRLTHLPTGITVTSTAQRTQQMNRSDATRKLEAVLRHIRQQNKAVEKNAAWRAHNGIRRGNPVRTYRGREFKRV